MMGIITVVVCCLFAGGAFYFGRHLEVENGAGTVPTMLKGVGALVLALGLVRGGWMLVRNGGLTLPSFGREPPVSAHEFTLMCQTQTGMSSPEVSASWCECAANAVDAARVVDPDFYTRRDLTRFEGTTQGSDAFRASFGRCANTRARTWLSEECRVGCTAEGASLPSQGQQREFQMRCSQICRCVVSWGMEGQTPQSITDLFWSGTQSHETPEAVLNGIVSRGIRECQARAR